jgi:hypothetical protein
MPRCSDCIRTDQQQPIRACKRCIQRRWIIKIGMAHDYTARLKIGQFGWRSRGCNNSPRLRLKQQLYSVAAQVAGCARNQQSWPPIF